MKTQTAKFAALPALWLALAGCAPLAETGTPPATPVAAQAAEQPATAAATGPDAVHTDTQYRDFEPDTLFGLLVAEIAGYRNQFDVALANYLGQARRTRDPGIAERAARIAQYVGARAAALEAAQIWLEGDPQALDAHKLAAKLLIDEQNLAEAMHHLEFILEQEGEAGFDFLALNAQSLEEDDRGSVLDAFDHLLTLHPDNPQLLFGKAILLRQAGELEEALVLSERLLQAAPDYVQGHILYGRLLQENGQHDAAIASLSASLQRFPDEAAIRQQYARILIDAERVADAAEQFELLVRNDPQNADLIYSLGLVYMELDRQDKAEQQFRQLLQLDNRTDEANYYLGTIQEDRGDFSGALEYYARVSSEGANLGAPARVARLKAEHEGIDSMRAYLDTLRGKEPELETPLDLLEIEVLMELKALDEAMTTVNAGLRRDPDDINLLYARAMVAEKQGNLEKLEEDLNRILELDPENAAALNALGYTLADRTDRYQEALELISKAIALKPDDPAITDSLGWVQYRLGNYEEALRLLRQAFDQFPDHEVAAHLGEVLWVTGNEPEARRVWLEALQRTPDSELLQRVMQRFQVHFD